MAAATIGSLRIVLGLDSAELTGGLTAAQKQLKAAAKQMQSVGKTVATIGAGMSAAITAPFIALGFHLLQGSQDAAAAAAQVNAALNSMGDASGKTADELAKSAEALRNLTGIDDDEIMKGVTANLLTFGKISGPIFDRTQAAILDISARLGTDLQSATLMVGKALNDPIKGLSALRRTGIQFTEQQENQIKAMQGVGDIAGAQAVMLSELEKQFGGAAKAAADADIWTPIKTMIMDLEGAFEPIVRDVVGPLIKMAADLGRTLAGLNPQFIMFIAAGAAIAAALGPALLVIGGLISALGAITAAFATGGILVGFGAFVVAAAPFIAAAAAIAAALWVFRDDLMPILQEFAAAVMEAVGPMLPGLMEAAKSAFSSFGSALKAVFDVVGPILADLLKLFLQVFGPILLTSIRALVAGFTSAFQIIGQALRVVSALLRGDWQGAWNAAGSLVMSVVQGLGRIIEAVFPGALRWMERLYTGVRDWLQNKLGGVFTWVGDKAKAVGDAFFTLYDRVVGHSYIPDMVDEIGLWIAKLDGNMVQPVKKGTEAAAQAFEQMRQRASAAIESLLTDDERALKQHLETVKALQAAIDGKAPNAAAASVALQRENDQWSTRDLKMPTITPTQDLGGPALDALNKFSADLNDRITKSRERFADAFEYGINAAMRGDWKGVLQSIFGDVMSSTLRSIGSSIFNAAGGGSPGGFSWSSLASSAASIFSNLPGFADGGTIKAGGTGGVDSQLVSFWKSPSEQVDIYDPGRDAGPAGSGLIAQIVPSPYFSVEVQRVAAPMVMQGAVAATEYSAKSIPRQMAHSGRQKFRGGF